MTWLLILLGSLIVFTGCTEEDEWYFPAASSEMTDNGELPSENNEITEKIANLTEKDLIFLNQMINYINKK